VLVTPANLVVEAHAGDRCAVGVELHPFRMGQIVAEVVRKRHFHAGHEIDRTCSRSAACDADMKPTVMTLAKATVLHGMILSCTPTGSGAAGQSTLRRARGLPQATSPTRMRY